LGASAGGAAVLRVVLEDGPFGSTTLESFACPAKKSASYQSATHCQALPVMS